MNRTYTLSPVSLLLPLLAFSLLLLIACKNPDVVQAGGTKPLPPVSTTVTAPATSTTAVIVSTSATEPNSLSGLLRQVVQSGPSASLTTTFGYELLSPTSPMLLASYTTVSGSPASATVLIVSLTRTGALVTGQRETRSVANRLVSATRTYTYNAQGLLTKQSGPDEATGQDQADAYTYNETGQLIGWQRTVGTSSKATTTGRADLTWQGANVRFVREEDADGNVEETTWQADNLPNYRRRYNQSQGLPPGYDPDLLNANNPAQSIQQFSGRRSRYEYVISPTDQLTQRILSDQVKGQWVPVMTETYTYY